MTIERRVVTRHKAAKLTPQQKGWERRREKDDFAEQNIPPEYIEEHPGENDAWLQENADREIAKIEREHQKQVRLEQNCNRNRDKYEDARYKEQERQTREKARLKRLKQRTDEACRACPTCDVEPDSNYEPVPFAASASMAVRVAAKYKSKKKLDSGNTVYTYSEQQIALRNKKKAEQIAKLEKQLGSLRKQVRRDLHSDDPDTMLTALAVALIDHTYERVGNEDSAKDGHFGVTGWQRKHISFGRDKATIRYVGKSGVKHEKVVSDRTILKALRNVYEATDGDDTSIFEYDGGKVDARKVNAYLEPFGVTAKDIRGLHANREMRERLTAIRARGKVLPDDPKKREKQLAAEFKKALEATAEAVGHEAATLRSQYLVPGLEEQYLKDGTIDPIKVATYLFRPALMPL